MPVTKQPIYVFTYFLQRLQNPNLNPGETEKDPPVEKNFYRIVPGRKVEIYFYNTADAKYKPAGSLATDKLEFWQPNELMSWKAAQFLLDDEGTYASEALATDADSAGLLNPADVVKIKFVNDNKMPTDADGNEYPSGVYDTTIGGIWAIEAIAGGS